MQAREDPEALVCDELTPRSETSASYGILTRTCMIWLAGRAVDDSQPHFQGLVARHGCENQSQNLGAGPQSRLRSDAGLSWQGPFLVSTVSCSMPLTVLGEHLKLLAPRLPCELRPWRESTGLSANRASTFPRLHFVVWRFLKLSHSDMPEGGHWMHGY
jgi:hypothetical protein